MTGSADRDGSDDHPDYGINHPFPAAAAVVSDLDHDIMLLSRAHRGTQAGWTGQQN